MATERILQLLTALLAAQGSVMLGISSENSTLPLLTIAAAALSLYVTDRYQWFYLQGPVANLAAVCALLVSVYDFLELERDRQLLAIAYLLIYLQIVLLFQIKNERIYWQLHLLSLLQVIVATAISSSLSFGLLLITYLYFCLWTGFVFFVFRQKNRQSTLPTSATPDSPTTNLPNDAKVVNYQKGFQARLALVALRQAAGICLLAFLTFLLLPRTGDGISSPKFKLSGARMIGFTDSVRLGELGTAIESQEPVLRLWFSKSVDDKPFRLIGPPMLRGAVVNYYKNGTWSISRSLIGDQEIELPIAPPNAVMQRIAMAPLRERTVFALYPPAVIDRQTPVAFNLRTRQLVRTTSQSTPFDVVLTTSGIHNRRQKRFTPIGPTDSIDGASLLQPFYGDEKSTDAIGRLEPLRKLTQEILNNANLAESETAEQAEAICNYLKSSTEFSYTLDAQQRDLSVDPIVDFLTKNPQGHCEYFSSALTLMLRSAGIRSRMIIGFQGGEWNHLGGYYQIRQKDAHSWTEAYIPPGEIKSLPNGGWLRLDPTPRDSSGQRQASGSVALQFFSEMRNYAEFLWAKYVIQLDADRQQEDIYNRLAEWANALIDAAIHSVLVREKEKSQEALAGEADTPNKQSAAKEIDWWRVAVWTSAVPVLIGCILLLRKFYRNGIRKIPATSEKRIQLPQRPFYRQWEQLLARYLVLRRPEQTARQHAVQIADQLIECGLEDQRDVPKRIVDAHYAFAFGSRLPATDTEAELTQMIAALGKALATKQRDALKTP